MSKLKYAVLACGLVGLVGCFIPEHGVSFWTTRELLPTELGGGFHVFLVIGAYVLATAMGVLAIAKPPLLHWQSLLAIASFALVPIKFRSLLVDLLKHGNLGVRMMLIAAIVGVIVSVVALVKAEPA